MRKNSPDADGVRIPWKKVVRLDLLLIALLVLSTRFATFLHEVFGHTGVALLSGGEVHRIKISLFGGGMVEADLGGDHLAVVMLYWYSGILVNLITGALPFFFLNKIKRANLLWALFWAVFVLTSLLGTFAYLVLGLYYEFGDPVNWVRVTPQWLALSWIPFLIAAPVVSHTACRVYVSVQQRYIPSKDFFEGLKITCAALGISVLVYAGLFWLTDQRLASANAPLAAYQREATRIIEKKKEELAQRIRAVHPELTEAEIQARVNDTPIHVSRDEVPEKFPMVPVLAILFLLGALTALKKGEMERMKREDTVAHPKPEAVFLLCLLAVIVISALALRGETIYEVKRKNDRYGSLRMRPGNPHLKIQGEGISLMPARGLISISGTDRFAEPVGVRPRFGSENKLKNTWKDVVSLWWGVAQPA